MREVIGTLYIDGWIKPPKGVADQVMNDVC
jgi:hypothetical protein